MLVFWKDNKIGKLLARMSKKKRKTEREREKSKYTNTRNKTWSISNNIELKDYWEIIWKTMCQ